MMHAAKSTDWASALDDALPFDGGVDHALDAPAAETATHARHTSNATRVSAVDILETIQEGRQRELVTMGARETDGYLALLQQFVKNAPWGNELPEGRMIADQLQGIRLIQQLGIVESAPNIVARTGLPSGQHFREVDTLRDDLTERVRIADNTTRTSDNPAVERTLGKRKAFLQAAKPLARLGFGTVDAKTLRVDQEADLRTIVARCDRIVHPGVIERLSVEIERPLSADRPGFFERLFEPLLRRFLGDKRPERRQRGELLLSESIESLLKRPTGDLEQLAQVLRSNYGGGLVRVSRGTIGPIWFGGGSGPEAIQRLVDAQPGAAVASFSLERIQRSSNGEAALSRTKESRWLHTAPLEPQRAELESLARDGDAAKVFALTDA